jgi:hypothetical protein
MKQPRDTLHNLPSGDADLVLAHLIEIRNVAAGVVEDLDDLIRLTRSRAAAISAESTDEGRKRPPGRGRSTARGT